MRKNIIFDKVPSVRTYDDNGFLHVELTPISKACVNPYLGSELPSVEGMEINPDQIYYGLRDANELEKATNTFNGLPLLLNHHEINAATQPKQYIVGCTGTNAMYEYPYLKNSLTITDAEAIKCIEDGSMKEISCAYRFTPDFTAGVFEDGEGNKINYDFIMRDISGNHVALVKEGRAGHDVKVADSLPKKLNRGGKMNKKILDFKRKRIALAQDANLGIEASEVLSAGFQKALNAIEAQVEGYDPREVGLEIDASATIDDIINKFMPGLDEETKMTYKGVLEKLKGDTPEAADANAKTAKANDLDFAEGVKYGEKLEKNPEERKKLDSEHESEGMKKAEDDDFDERMKDPAFKAGFEAGTRYGEKREKADPKKLDSEHESEGMKRYLGEDSIIKIKAQIAADTKKHYRALNAAAAKVRPLVGTINDPLAYDSAEDIYAFALRQKGKDPARYNKMAYAGMIDILLDSYNNSYARVADSGMYASTLSKDTEAAFERLNSIL